MTDMLDLFNRASDSIKDEWLSRRSIMSFSDYLKTFGREPRLHLRDASRFVLDAIDHFGSKTIARPWGNEIRYNIFDQEFADPDFRLVGQEMAQSRIRDAIASQVRDGRVNRLIVIHGPNGSSKSTMIASLFRGLEHYSRLDKGKTYRFRWIFPSRTTSQGKLGFGSRLSKQETETFAHLSDEDIDSTLECEMRDHPLLLLPKASRMEIMHRALEEHGMSDYQIPDSFMEASLCHRCRQVADALMRTHQGDMFKVLAHVQVERWAISRRYRRGIVQVGPQMSSDAAQRQITADRSLAALPTELQNMTLFETFGPLVDGAGGIIEFEDMLKRSLESFKYLLGTIETGEVLLGQSILKLNSILMSTTNDVMLEAFREHHEWPSFRDRLTLVPVPYLTQISTERRIYELQLVPNIGRHVAPHAVTAAALWAVLNRLHKPDPEGYDDNLKKHIEALTAAQKADLYDSGLVPGNLDNDEAAQLRDNIKHLRKEDATVWNYEGSNGPSPRLIRQVLLQASLSDNYSCLSPFAVIEQLDELCERVREHQFLEREKQDGGYFDAKGSVAATRDHVLEKIEDDVRTASGLVEETRYLQLMNKYVNHVSHFVKKEKILNTGTGNYEDPDESLMSTVEESLGIQTEKDEFRRTFISRIAAWAIDHPGQRVHAESVFPDYIKKMKNAYFQEHRLKVAKIAKHALMLTREQSVKMDQEMRNAAETMLTNLRTHHDYCDDCVQDALFNVLKDRLNHHE